MECTFGIKINIANSPGGKNVSCVFCINFLVELTTHGSLYGQYLFRLSFGLSSGGSSDGTAFLFFHELYQKAG